MLRERGRCGAGAQGRAGGGGPFPGWTWPKAQKKIKKKKEKKRGGRIAAPALPTGAPGAAGRRAVGGGGRRCRLQRPRGPAGLCPRPPGGAEGTAPRSALRRAASAPAAGPGRVGSSALPVRAAGTAELPLLLPLPPPLPGGSVSPLLAGPRRAGALSPPRRRSPGPSAVRASGAPSPAPAAAPSPRFLGRHVVVPYWCRDRAPCCGTPGRRKIALTLLLRPE